MLSFKYYACILCLFISALTYAQPSPVEVKKWQDQKFSMFIHFGGIYSVLGGVWDGKPVTRGLSEQIQSHAGIYSDVYANVAKRFNPEKWNADSIVLLAKAAGMHSIVFTSKHHDGFCMFKTATTDFNVVDATPYKRDIVKELSEACKRHGLRFGLYFSLIDWHYPQASPISSHNSDYITPEHHEYNKKQVTELLSNYGTISELWFDMGSQTPAQSSELSQLVHRLQPNCMVSGRLGNDQGDFMVMADNHYPDYAIGVPWQTPASFFDETWSYRSWQKRGSETDKFKEKLESLVGVVSKGGNYLLNIGPKGDGSVVPFEKDVLLMIGRWLNKNAEAVYGTSADPFFSDFKWGNITSRPDKLYLFVINPPADGTITLPGLEGKITGAKVLGEGTTMDVSEAGNNATIKLPAGFSIPGEIKVIAVDLPGGYKISPVNVIKSAGGRMVLDQHNAYNYNSSSGIDYGTYFQTTIKQLWTIAPAATGVYQPVLTYTNEEKGREVDLTINDKTSTLEMEGGKELLLKTDLSKITWGKVYQSGPYQSLLGSKHFKSTEIDVSKPYAGDSSIRWHEIVDYQNAKQIMLPGGDVYSAYYVLQNISSPKAAYVQVKITSGDGVVVYLNGKRQFIHNNPDKAASVSDVVGLNLVKGNNQLLIQLYNSFKKEIPFALDHAIEQKIYQKNLDALSLDANKLYPVTWKLHNPPSPHQTMNVPNIELSLSKK